MATTSENSRSMIEPAEVINPGGESPILLVCEHASRFIPEHYDNLGLDGEAAASHIAWDPGALELAKRMSERLDARLVAGTISRLVYDCNRPPDSPTAIPSQSEAISVPGNIALNETLMRERIEQIYEPFAERLGREVSRSSQLDPVLVTIHSFTPVFLGKRRSVEIGILHDTDTRLADAVLDISSGCSTCEIARNQPYGPEDGVTHTLKLHGIKNGILNVMIEVANNLIVTVEQQREMATLLCAWLNGGLARLAAGQREEKQRCRA